MFAVNSGSIQIEGENTMVHDNCTDGNSDDYGLAWALKAELFEKQGIRFKVE